VKRTTFHLHSRARPELGAPNYGYGFAVGVRTLDIRLFVGHGGNAPRQRAAFGALKDTPDTIINPFQSDGRHMRVGSPKDPARAVSASAG
jgi:hypothetical protein